MKKALKVFSLIFLLSLGWSCASKAETMDDADKLSFPATDHPVRYAGLRSSSYGVSPFPGPESWAHAMNEMASYFPGSEPCGIWIIGNVEGSRCKLQFPTDGGGYDNIRFSSTDKHERYLELFDELGISVFLQIEPGAGSVPEMIRLALDRYGHHPSVVGFGVDLEWYNPEGKTGMNGYNFYSPLSTEDAMAWDALIKSYNPDYRMFLKHWIWDETIMPQETTSDIIFISDSQGFNYPFKGEPNEHELAMEFAVKEFTEDWAANFRLNDNVRAVGFQIGYESDQGFWEGLMARPYPQNYSNAILQGIPAEQEVSFFWVDFTMKEVFSYDD